MARNVFPNILWKNSVFHLIEDTDTALRRYSSKDGDDSTLYDETLTLLTDTSTLHTDNLTLHNDTSTLHTDTSTWIAGTSNLLVDTSTLHDHTF